MKRVCYCQDDILICGKGEKDNDDKLKNVLEKVQSSDLTVKAEKCKIKVNSVTYLGRRVRPIDKLVDSLVKSMVPSNKDGVKSFLGVIELYAKFIEHFSDKIKSMRNLLKKSFKCEWCEGCHKKFDKIKLEITNAPHSGSLDMSCKTLLSTDYYF